MTSVRRALAISFAERYALIVLALAGNMLVALPLLTHRNGNRPWTKQASAPISMRQAKDQDAAMCWP